MSIIEVVALRKTWPGPVEAVREIGFAVEEGAMFALLGPNGAGKSTTMRILATLSAADGGRVRINGHDLADGALAIRRSIGYVAQGSTADQLLTGAENLLLQGRLYGLAKRELGHRVSELLALLDLKDAAHRQVRTWSGGMRRRLDLAMGIVHGPRVLLLDEPTTSLDPESRTAVWRELLRLRQQLGMTILFSTHYLEEADRHADRVAIIDRGRIVAEDTPAALKAALEGDRVDLVLRDRTALAEAAATLGKLEIVHSVTERDGHLELRVRDGARAMPQIVGALPPDSLVEVAMTRPSLDDVYLSVTGRHYEAAGTEITP
ncbi:MAG: ATP-binding cassette domain-containing protein [Rhodothalassiaceae bacterium]